MSDWKREAVSFFKKVERKIKNNIPCKSKVKDIKWDNNGMVEIVYEQ